MSVVAMAVADFRERTRRQSFVAALALVGWLAYVVASGRLALRLDDYEGVMNAAWLGSLVAMVASLILGWLGFYLVKSAIELDRHTGMGAVLAASPISRVQYTLAKWLSNFAVLGLLVAMLMIASLFLHWRHAQTLTGDLPALLAPILILAVPSVAVTAACAVLFESVPLLRGGVGNALWFLGLPTAGMLSAQLASGRMAGLDLWGMMPLFSSMAAAARAEFPSYRGTFRLAVIPNGEHIGGYFPWAGLEWSPEFMMQRMLWLVLALALALLAAACFDRFDPSRAAAVPEGPEVAASADEARPEVRGHARAEALAAVVRGFSPAYRMYVELHLLLKGTRPFAYAVALGLAIGGLLATSAGAREMLLLAAWIWPLLVWSSMGCREARDGMSEIVQACGHPLLLRFPAQWLAGFLVAAVSGGGVLTRLLITGDADALLAWVTAAVLIPSLALMLGTVTGATKGFEVLYLALCYVGPLNGVAPLDFIAESSASPHWVWLACSATCVVITLLWRWRQARG
jgi:hypothetical protein